MKLEIRMLTCMDKVFLDEAPQASEPVYQGFQNERIDFQVAFRAQDTRWTEVEVHLHGPLQAYARVRQVMHVPVRYAMPEEEKESCLRSAPGLYPDLLSEIRPHALHASPRWSCLWVRLEPPEGHFAPGEYPLSITFRDGEGNAYAAPEARILILPGLLPPQKLIHTKWFHCDGLCQYYGVEPFSERHWEIIGNFMRCAVQGSINMILMPVHTPPLDTREGGQRLVTQLADIALEGNEYRFDLSRVRRWIALCKACGVEYYEIAHLFTQWGAFHAPCVMATVNGETRQLFGWDTDAAGEAYGRFLQSYIPALRACFAEEGIEKNVFWHISDEPSREQMKSYAAARGQVEKLLQGCQVIDAQSDLDFYRQGLIAHPIPANDRIAPFLEAKVPDLWTYYCCGQTHRVSNMFIALPSYRNRILGTQLFKFGIKGFLQWGFNFYNSCLSDYPIDPYQTTDADGWVPAGDPFQVYPGPDGMPEESIRMAVTFQALQDLRALELLSSLIGREKVIHLIDEGLSSPLTFSEYPQSNAYLLSLRRRINAEIASRLQA